MRLSSGLSFSELPATASRKIGKNLLFTAKANIFTLVCKRLIADGKNFNFCLLLFAVNIMLNKLSSIAKHLPEVRFPCSGGTKTILEKIQAKDFRVYLTKIRFNLRHLCSSMPLFGFAVVLLSNSVVF